MNKLFGYFFATINYKPSIMKKILFWFILSICYLVVVSCESSTDSSTTQYTVTLTPSPSEGGSVSASTQVYDEGSVATIVATPADEWVFVRWEGDFTGTSGAATFTVDSDKNITAIFEKRNYALTVNTSGEGTVDEQVIQAKSTDYESGTVVELTALPDNGWGFVRWEGALTGDLNPIQITVDDPKQVTAVFSQVYLAANGVTIRCEDAKLGATGTINGITYTKRTVEQITPSNAATTCTSSITDMSNLFNGELSFNGDISSWDVSNVSNMEGMFYEATAFNQDISSWDVGNVTSMQSMFERASDFNQDLSAWDVSSVINMNSMFEFASIFNQDLSNWNVSSVTNMGNMFQGAEFFNSNLNNWDVSSVTEITNMFRFAYSFNGDVSSWDVSSITRMNNLFVDATSFNGDVSNWDVSSVTNMRGLFSGATSFNGDISNWDVSSVTDFSIMFADATSFNSDLSQWDVSSATDIVAMFAGATLFNQDISNWNVANVTMMEALFADASSFNQDLSGWCVTNIASEPLDFSTNSPLTNGNKPIWGTCPAN